MLRGLPAKALLRAFTLIELLTVIAISAILLTLIIVPVIQGFNLTRAAQGFADAQDKARIIIEGITREISNAAGVMDNGGMNGTVFIEVPGLVPPPPPETQWLVPLEYAKLDVVRPAEGEPIRGPSGAFINPNTGKEDPTARAPIGQMVLPVTPGDTIVRYFIGLRDPFNLYFNGFDGLLMPRQGGTRDNLFVLWRAEVHPYVWNPNATGGPRYVVNTSLFDVDPNSTVPGDPDSGAPLLNDPYFFLHDRDRFGNFLVPGPALTAKQLRVQNWLRSSVVLTEATRYDMILPLFDKRTRGVVYDNNVPRILPLAQFRPTSIGNEPAEGMAAVRLNTESDNETQFAPDVFRTKFGGYTATLIRHWPNGWTLGNPAFNEYLIGRATVPGGPFEIFLFDPNVNANEKLDGVRLFSLYEYEKAVKNNLTYPFSRSLDLVNLSTQFNRERFGAFQVQRETGKVIASFDIGEVGDFNVSPPVGGNLPAVQSGPALSPIQDPIPPGTLFDPQYSPSNAAYEINSSFNKMWEVWASLRPNIHRIIDLRVSPMPDGTASPLHPNPTIGLARASIVPGSDVLIGPDQNPGPNFGQPIRFERTTRVPGPNQYRINYVDLPEPTDYGLLGIPSAEVAAFLALGGLYSSSNFISSFVQPRYKAGYVQLYSDPNVPIPAGNIRISYRFQFTKAGDTLGVDYDSKHLMSVLLTVRNFPQTTIPNPQTITVKGTATARNVLR